MPDSLRRIGFIGTGIMGLPMARRLIEAGFEISAWNRTAEKAEALRQAGARLAASAVEAARDADAVICMLSSGPVCDAVLAEPKGVIAAMQPGSTLVVMSSIPVAAARSQAALAAGRGVDMSTHRSRAARRARSRARWRSWPGAKLPASNVFVRSSHPWAG